MLFPLALLVATASAGLSTEQLLELQRVRERVEQHVRTVCDDASCVRWDARLRVWRFARGGVLTSALPEDARYAPSGNAWTDGKLVHFFPEFAPQELALDAMHGPVSSLWMALVRWLAEDPRRLESYGPPMWSRFLAAHSHLPHLQVPSPWGRLYTFGDFVDLGMTADALRTAVTILRCETPVEKAIETQLAREDLTSDLFSRWSTSGALAKDWLVDAWGTPLLLQRLLPGRGQVRLRRISTDSKRLSEADLLREWTVSSAGPDQKHGSGDDIGCGDARLIEGPARLTPYGYRPSPPGPYDEAIEEALIIQRMREEIPCKPLVPPGVPPASPP